MTTLALSVGEPEKLTDTPATDVTVAEQVTNAFRELHRPVYLYLHNIVANRAVAEDLTQETFLRLLREFHRGVRIDHQRAWVFRVATNLALSYKKNRGIARTVVGLNQTPYPDGSPDPEEAFLQTEAHRLLAAGMSCLSAHEQQCLLLRAEGLRYREIADVLNIRISTVATFVTRAVRKLSESIHG